MNKLIAIFTVCVTVSGSICHAEGGVVGSGAGIVEMNFQYAYSNLATWIDGCQAEKICETEGSHGELLKKIQNLFAGTRNQTNRLIFRSALADPGSFRTGINEPNRIAKTELNPQASIYINVDLLYAKGGGAPMLEVPEIAGVLVHEVGHQVGEESHDLLNILGAQIREYLNRTISLYSFEVGSRPEVLKMRVINQLHPYRISQLQFNWGSRYAIDLTTRVSTFAVCNSQTQSLSGFELFNGYFVPNTQDNIKFNVWMKVYCYNKETETFETMRNFIQILLRSDQKISIKSTPEPH